MFEKLKHTNRCEECKKLYQYNNYTEPTKCSCGGKLVYIGFQPEMDSLTIMINDIKNQFETNDTPTIEKSKSAIIEETFPNKILDVETEKIQEVSISNGITAREITKEEADKIEEQTIVEKQENVEKPAMAFELKDIIDISKKVTNAQMVPAIKNALSEHSKEKINMLKENFQMQMEN